MNDILVDAQVMAVPQHLKSCTQPIGCECSPTHYAGSLRCTCGCERFEVLHSTAAKQAVAAKCSDCGESYVLVDAQSVLNPRSKLKAHACKRCNGVHHHPEVTVEESESVLTSSGWTRGVRQTTIDLVCTDCGCATDEWVKTESNI